MRAKKMDRPTDADLDARAAALSDDDVRALCEDSWQTSPLAQWRPLASRMSLAREVLRLRASLAEAEAQVRAVVPLGDLSGVAAWTAADRQYRERIAALEAVLCRIQGACGLPDAHEACRVILALAAQALDDAEKGR